MRPARIVFRNIFTRRPAADVPGGGGGGVRVRSFRPMFFSLSAYTCVWSDRIRSVADFNVRARRNSLHAFFSCQPRNVIKTRLFWIFSYRCSYVHTIRVIYKNTTQHNTFYHPFTAFTVVCRSSRKQSTPKESGTTGNIRPGGVLLRGTTKGCWKL